MTKKVIDCYDVSEIQEVTLLSAKEWEKIMHLCPPDYSFWWIRDSAEYERAKIVSSTGHVDLMEYVENSWMRVRPAFKLEHKSKIGDKIMIGKTVCTVIGEEFALSDMAVCQHRFDAESNDFENSEIRRFINSNEFKEML